MSYDLVIFQAEGAPRDQASFETWCFEMMEDAGERDDFLAAPATAAMAAFFTELSNQFPVAGPNADTEAAAAYEFQANYMSIHFQWAVSSAASQRSLELAQKHGLGLYDLKGAVIFPDEDPHARSDDPPPPTLTGKVRKFFGF